MADTKIEWATKVWNPVTGCTKISVGCQNCYAKRMANRLRGRYGYPEDDPFRVTLHPEKIIEPQIWRKPQRIFVNSMSDLFHEDVPDEFIIQVFNAMATDILQPCKHIYMILTKRPERMAEFFRKYTKNGVKPWPNVWLGVSAENQEMADLRIPILLQIPAAVRFISVEPMLGPVDLTQWIRGENFEIEKCGGDSLSSGFSERVRDRLRGTDMESCPKEMVQMDSTNYDIQMQSKASGKRCGRLLHGESNDKQCPNINISSETCMASFLRENTTQYDDQSQKRQQEGQPSGQFGTRDVFGTNYSCYESFGLPSKTRRFGKICWVIVGGETGPHARPVHPDWVRNLRDQCQAAGVPFFFKQWGEYGTKVFLCTTGEPVFRQFDNFQRWVHKGSTWINGGTCIDTQGKICTKGMDFETASYPVAIIHKIGKKAAGDLLDGRQWHEFPEVAK